MKVIKSVYLVHLLINVSGVLNFILVIFYILFIKSNFTIIFNLYNAQKINLPDKYRGALTILKPQI